MTNFESNKNLFYKYIDSCRKEIFNLLFDNLEIINSTTIRTELVNTGMIDKYTTVSDAIKLHRNNMIDTKLNHTIRIVDDVSNLAEKLEFNDKFVQILKLAALLHDIARFPQAVNSNSFYDRECKMFNGDNHAEYGYKMLYINNMFKDFDIDKKHRFAIASAVRYHQIPVVTGDLALTFKNVNQLNINALTGKEDLSKEEKIIIATLVQIIKDVDMLDILYQHLTGEIPIIKESIKISLNDTTIDNISQKWGVSIEEILEYNEISIKDLKKVKSINIPVANMNLTKLAIPLDIKESFYNNDYMDLKKLQSRKDYTFITGMWWRLNHFLNNINFVSNLEILKEKKLLEQIYNLYPEEYKFLVKEAFEFAQEEILNKRIEQNKGKVYVRK